MQELWQLYSDDGKPIPEKGAPKAEVWKGLLHGAAHVWIWRKSPDGIEVLVQKRADTKGTWPNLLDISAAGHIDLGEEPADAGVRETKEEIGLSLSADDLDLIEVRRAHMVAPNGSIENEYRWLYAYELKQHETFDLEKTEVNSLIWKPLPEFKRELLENNKVERYVPQPDPYFERLLNYLENITL